VCLGRVLVCALVDHLDGRRGRLYFMGCGREVGVMAIPILASVLGLVLLIGGCAAPPLPGAAGEISGPLRSIDLQMVGKKEIKDRYRTTRRDRIFASDGEVWVYLHWALPGPGRYETKIVLRTPSGAIHEERHHTFEAKDPLLVSWNRFVLPKGEDAQRLAGPWQIEAFLGAAAVGHRTFTFDPSSIRLRTDARVLIVPGTYDPELATGDWAWRERFGTMENIKAAHVLLGVVLRDELARRFPNVAVTQQQVPAAPSDATVLLRTKLRVSPNPSADSEVVVEALAVPTQTRRTFSFRSSAGKSGATPSSNIYLSVAAADLAFEAASNPDLLEFLRTATNAVPE
jgi:hypothetical protein